VSKKLAIAIVVVAAVGVGLWSIRESPEAGSTLAPAVASPASSSSAAPANLVAAVRAAGKVGDLATAAKLVADDRAANGATPTNLEALSWMSRLTLAAKDVDAAERYARETHDLAQQILKRRRLDEDASLPTALGAAIEVLGQVAAARGGRTEAVLFYQSELAKYRDTSIAKRIQKNINLVSLEGTKAPALDLSEYLGRETASAASLRGRVVLMFFWAHWCSDCKAQAPVLASLQARYAARGLTIVAPTERFGYVAGGQLAPPTEERAYIAHVRETYYPVLERVAMPLAAGNHLRYGVSTTPTLVLIDRAGIIRVYHPGKMSEAELDPLVRALVDGESIRSSTSG
jgi:thiol-disulfide isomerase/thioredoxin